MKRLTIRREVLRDLAPLQLRDVNGGNIGSIRCTTAMSCTDPLGCIRTVRDCIVVESLQGCTTAINCP